MIKSKKKKTLENVTVIRKPPPSPPPSVLTLQPRYFCILCVYESAQLTTAPKELVLVFQTAAAKNENKTLEQLVNALGKMGFFEKNNVKYQQLCLKTQSLPAKWWKCCTSLRTCDIELCAKSPWEWRTRYGESVKQTASPRACWIGWNRGDRSSSTRKETENF